MKKSYLFFLVLGVMLVMSSSYAVSLEYSTFLGGAAIDLGMGIAVDTSGCVYILGNSESSDYPVTVGAYTTGYDSSMDIFVTKLNAAGNAILYSSYFGGSATENCNRIAVDTAGNAYVTGITWSSDFPTTAGAYQTSYSGNEDIFICKLNSVGDLVYSSLLGGYGIDAPNDLKVDANGQAYVVGYTESTTFPTTAGAYSTTPPDGDTDAFLSILSADGSSLVYSTFLGGRNSDYISNLAFDTAMNIYLYGYTYSNDFPVTSNAYDTTLSYEDLFITKLDHSSMVPVYSTFLGGSSDDYGNGIAVDLEGNAYVTGFTNSSDFPTTSGAYQTTYSGAMDSFVTKLNPAGSDLVYSTYLGGTNDDLIHNISLNTVGNAYVAGETYSTNFPITSNAYDTSFNGANDVFIVKLDISGANLDYSSFFGGTDSDLAFNVALDLEENVYITGYTDSSNFPTTAGAYKTSLSTMDAFVSKFNISETVPVELSDFIAVE